ncbi:unnamed protein product [Discula destructiva]
MAPPIQSDSVERSDTSLDAKYAEKQVEDALPRDSSSLDDAVVFDDTATRRLIRKIDWRLIPFLALLYLLSFLDRTNIGNARLDTLEADLNMSGLDYNHALAIFFPFYVVAEVPSNMMMKRFKPSVWIPIIMVAWGLCTTLMGIVQNYEGLLAVRAVLGFAEGGLFPGITYYITMWYRRHECGLRMAVFFSAATAAGAFGGLLARGIFEMRGVANLAGWRWLFILEGILTFLVAVAAFWIMYDYADTASFLSVAEKKEVKNRLKLDRSSLADEFDMKYFWNALKDWKIWVHMFITIGIYTSLYSYALFVPTIVAGLGYTNTTANLMTVPPYIVACFFCIGAGYAADKVKQRGLFIIGFCCIAMIGLAMLIATENNAVRYTGCFFLASGVYPNVPQGVAWNGNNIGGSLKRGVGIAMHVAFGNMGGMISAYLYQTKDRPRYFPGHGTLMGMQFMAAVLSTLMTIYLRRENARRDRMFKPPHEYTEAEREAEREMGDNASFFRYTI